MRYRQLLPPPVLHAHALPGILADSPVYVPLQFTGDAKKKIEADCGVGEINLKIKGKQKDYNYDLDCGIGEIRCGDDSFSGFGREKSIDNGADKKMDIDCGIGSINVAFMEQL